MMTDREYNVLVFKVIGGFAVSALLILLGAFLALQGVDALIEFGLDVNGQSLDLTTRSVGAFFALLGTLLAIYTIRTPLPEYQTARGIRKTRQQFAQLQSEAESPDEIEEITSERDDFEESLSSIDDSVTERLKTEYHQEELERKKKWIQDYKEKKRRGN